MQKLLDILEQYVEWIALGVAALFLLFVVVVYLIGTPVSGKVGEETVTLSNVDDYIYDTSAAGLESAMQHNALPQATIEPYARRFGELMELKQVPAPQAQGGLWMMAGVTPGAPVQQVSLASSGGPATRRDGAIAKLPDELPAPSFDKASMGRSSVTTSAEGAQAAAGPTSDKLWVTVGFTVSPDEIEKTLTAASIPSSLHTAFLRVQVIREEQFPDGKWGKPTEISPLAMSGVPEFPSPRRSSEQWSYLDWASRNVQTLLVPPFYQVVEGDQWYAPGQPNPNIPAEIKTVASPAPQPRQRSEAGMPRPRRSSRTPEYVPGDADRLNRAADVFYQAALPPEIGPEFPEAGFDPNMPAGRQANRPAITVPEGYMVPQGAFRPSELTQDIYFWVHDDTVESEKTYRYKAVYLLKNPVFGQRNLVQDDALAGQLALRSAESDWTSPITVPPITRFFIASGIGPGSSSVKMEVYRWQNGKWQQKAFLVSPGDMIGAMEDGVDYRTGWTLVDLKSDAMTREGIVLADPDGRLVARSYQADQGQIGKFKKDIRWVDPNATPPRAAPTAPPEVGPDMFGDDGGAMPEDTQGMPRRRRR